jgi:polar amino acid transport system permease protein
MRDLTWFDLLLLVKAAEWTLVLSVIAFAGGGILGGVIALARTSRLGPLRFIGAAYIQLLQGTPLLIQLFIWFFGLSLVGTNLAPIIAASAALTLNSSAFFAEIWRGSIQAIPRAQWEAAESLGLSRLQQIGYVITPQAVRLALAPTTGFMVQIIKNTSLAALIGFVELMRQAQIITNITFEPFPVYMTIAAVYFVLCFPLSLLGRYFEGRFHVGRSNFGGA